MQHIAVNPRKRAIPEENPVTEAKKPRCKDHMPYER